MRPFSHIISHKITTEHSQTFNTKINHNRSNCKTHTPAICTVFVSSPSQRHRAQRVRETTINLLYHSPCAFIPSNLLTDDVAAKVLLLPWPAKPPTLECYYYVGL